MSTGSPRSGSSEKRQNMEDVHTPSNKIPKIINRTLKACEACRKLKSKCYKAIELAVACSRCVNMNRTCSFEIDFKQNNPNIPLIDGRPKALPVSPSPDKEAFHASIQPLHSQSQLQFQHDIRHRIDLIYLGVAELLSVVKSEGALALKEDMKQLLSAASINKSNSSIPSSLYMGQSLSSGDSNYQSVFDVQNGNMSTIGSTAPEKLFESPNIIEPDLDADPSYLCSASKSFQVSPFCIVTKQVSNVPASILNLINTSRKTSARPKDSSSHDIIASGILLEAQVVDLMKEFRSNYGRWVLFPLQMFTDELIRQLRIKSPLLLTTCCTISLRYLLNNKSDESCISEALTFGRAICHLSKDLKKAILRYTIGNEGPESDIEFLQAMVIICIYLSSLSTIATALFKSEHFNGELAELQNLKMDPWNLSGLALSNFISNSCFGNLLRSKDLNVDPLATVYPSFETDETQKITVFRTYNHLILIHLVSCILTGRMCVVDDIRLRYCNLSLGLHSATNFDGRMVSEIGILLIAYNYIQVNLNTDAVKTLSDAEENLMSVKQEVESWYEQWEYLFRQPALQFVEFCYNFCNVHILLSYIHAKILIASKLTSRHMPDYTNFDNFDILQVLFNNCNDETLTKILHHAFHLVNFVLLVEDDSYFAYLSDQIFFFFYFGAIVLVKATRYALDHEKLYCLNDIDESFDEKNWQGALTPVRLVIEKFGRIANRNSYDIITQYRKGLTKYLRENFPKFV